MEVREGYFLGNSNVGWNESSTFSMIVLTISCINQEFRYEDKTEIESNYDRIEKAHNSMSDYICRRLEIELL
jgi:hypothetical protein